MQGLQALGQQRLGALDQFRGTRDFHQRVVLQLRQASAQQAFGLQQQVDFIQVQGQQVGLVFAGQLIEGGRQFGDRHHTGHRSTALEGVQRTLQLVSGLQRQVFGGLLEKTLEAVEVGVGFVAENVQQLRVGGAGVRPARRLGQRSAPGQRVGTGRQAVDIIALALVVGGEFRHQFRQQLQRIAQQLIDLRPRLDTVFEHSVEQVLHGPGELAEHQRTDHAPTAFQRMKGPAQFAQDRCTAWAGRPARQVLAQDIQDFGGLLEEHLAQLVIHRVFIGRRW